MQSEVEWFKAVARLAKHRFRYELNGERFTPHALFIHQHDRLVIAAKKSMQTLAQSATTVGSLIITAMFAVLFTAPGGNNQTTGYPVFISEYMFKLFVIFDALSLFSSTTSVLVFLGILTSDYSATDFEHKLPGKLLFGYATLFSSIVTMMLTFCAALAIMSSGWLLLAAPIMLISLVPAAILSREVCPLLCQVYNTTYGGNIFEKNNATLKGRDHKYDGAAADYDLSDEKVDAPKVMSYSYTVDKMV